MPDGIDSAASANNAMVKAVDATPEEVAPEPSLTTPNYLDASQLRETGNSPDVSYEEAALEALFGPPDADGVYGRPEASDA